MVDDIKSLLPYIAMLIVVVVFIAFAASMATAEVVQSVMLEVPMN
jgi:hypothetical protein